MQVLGPGSVSLEAGSGLSDGWLLLGHDEERLRKLFAGGVAYLFEAIDTPSFVATGGKIFFQRGGRRALSSEDLAKFMDEGRRLGAAVAGAL